MSDTPTTTHPSAWRPCVAESHDPAAVAAAVQAQAADPQHPTSAELAALRPLPACCAQALRQAVQQRTSRPAPRLPHYEAGMAAFFGADAAPDADCTPDEQAAWIAAGSPVGLERERLETQR